MPLERRLDELEPRPLITAGVSPHAPYTVDLEDYRRWVGLARERGMPVATHLLEGNLDETPAAYFRDVLGPDTAVIHAVTADAADIALFAELGVPVVHCPRSNALLGCGIAPVPALREAGVRVAPGHRLAGLRADPRHVGRDAGRNPAGPGAARPGRTC